MAGTVHLFMVGNSNNISEIESNLAQLVVTSPPYPMVQMWDDMFIKQNPEIESFLNENPRMAFGAMHALLDEVWRECDRILVDGGFVCINIGDAVRTMNEKFEMYPNHLRILEFFYKRGYSVLPDIHWRKVTNAPNKFMGSGMYPCGAYVTYEHEYILIFRKGASRKFTEEEKKIRRESGYFWEERNVWFSDLWEIKGASQSVLNIEGREKKAAFPFEIPYRLINMYSMKGDTVLDPFAGFGTTALAAMASGRNSISVEIENEIVDATLKKLGYAQRSLNKIIDNRIKGHVKFIDGLDDEAKTNCYQNIYHDFLVKTKQEAEIRIEKIEEFYKSNNTIVCMYGDSCQPKKVISES